MRIQVDQVIGEADTVASRGSLRGCALGRAATMGILARMPRGQQTRVREGSSAQIQRLARAFRPGDIARLATDRSLADRSRVDRNRANRPDRYRGADRGSRADALFVELTGERREYLGAAIAPLRAVLESQDETTIRMMMEHLYAVIAELRPPVQ
jgi:hypothetical protein